VFSALVPKLASVLRLKKHHSLNAAADLATKAGSDMI